jgi:hypothetical protein
MDDPRSVNTNAEDTPTWNNAMGHPHGEDYWQACKKESDTLISMEVCEELQ